MEAPSELHGVYLHTAQLHEGASRMGAPSATDRLLVDLRSCDYTLGSSGTWHNRATIGKRGPDIDAIVPSGVQFDEAEKAFVFAACGDVITVPLKTNPHFLTEVTYALWVKVRNTFANLAWLMCQYPDYGWSRALTLNDYRLGHISVTTSQYWDSELGQAPLGEWIHVAGVWHCNGTATVYLNGVRGATAVAQNGKSANCSDEVLLIGGRSPHDQAHNSALLVSDVCVFGRALGDEEVRKLHSYGRASEALDPGSLVLSEVSLSTTISASAGKLSCSSASKPEPIWDEATSLFWCNTRVNAYDLPDGSKWQQEFRTALEEATPALEDHPAGYAEQGVLAPPPPINRRILMRNGSDVPPPGAVPPRVLAKNPSDPDKRTVRAAHTQALRKMRSLAGIELRLLGRNIALFRFEGRVFAVDAQCPHQGASLCEGEVGDIEDLVEGHRFYIRCKVHKFQFDLTSGAVIDGACPPLHIYNARVREGESLPDGSSTKATIEVGFETLPAEYFEPEEDDDW